MRSSPEKTPLSTTSDTCDVMNLWKNHLKNNAIGRVIMLKSMWILFCLSSWCHSWIHNVWHFLFIALGIDSSKTNILWWFEICFRFIFKSKFLSRPSLSNSKSRIKCEFYEVFLGNKNGTAFVFSANKWSLDLFSFVVQSLCNNIFWIWSYIIGNIGGESKDPNERKFVEKNAVWRKKITTIQRNWCITSPSEMKSPFHW